MTGRLFKKKTKVFSFNQGVITDKNQPPTNEKGEVELYALAVLDIFSGYSNYYPLFDLSEKSIKSAMDQYIRTFGYPTLIQSDNAPYFEAKEFQNWITDLGIAYRFSPVRHPESNGRVERNIGVFKAMLQKLIIEKGYTYDNWPELLGIVQLTMNTLPHYIHGYSPYHLTFAQEPNGMEFNKETLPLPKETISTSVINRILQLDEWEQTISSVGKFIEYYRTQQSKELNDTLKPRALLPVGSQVVIPNHDKTSGSALFVGPFVIEQTNDNFTYLLRPLGVSKTTWQGTKFIKRTYHHVDLYPVPRQNESEYGELETIDDETIIDDEPHVKVHWKGSPKTSFKWLPKASLSVALINRFDKRKDGKLPWSVKLPGNRIVKDNTNID